MNNLKNIVFISVFGVLCIMVVIHTGINANNVKKPIKEKNEVLWDVVFKTNEITNEIIVNKTENIEYELPQLFDSIVNDFNIVFNKSQEKIIYTFYISNESEYDGFILHYNKPKVSCVNNEKTCIDNLDKINYSFVYDDGVEVALNDVIKAKEKKKVHIKIEYTENEKEIPMHLTKLGFSLTFAKVK